MQSGSNCTTWQTAQLEQQYNECLAWYDACIAELNSQRSWSTWWSTLAGVWMTVNTRCLINWQCSMNLYELLWIRRKDTSPTVMSLIQDVILAATTFVWTLMVIALVVSGLLFAIASISWKDTQRAKKIIIDCFVWLLLVMWSYTIVRLIQFLAMAKK